MLLAWGMVCMYVRQCFLLNYEYCGMLLEPFVLYEIVLSMLQGDTSGDYEKVLLALARD